MARAVVLTADLLFGSNIQGALVAAGHEVQIVAGEDALRAVLIEGPRDVVVVDLTDHELEAVQAVRELRDEGFLDRVPVLGYYSHVEPAVRALAEAEGFQRVVARSRMAREAAGLIEGLTGG